MQMNELGYEDGALSLAGDVDKPSYEACLGWMKEIPDERAITLDFWSRGNFVRRMLYQRKHEHTPLLIPASNTNQMRWAFRRLALTGTPVDFVYTGPLSAPRFIKHWHPLDIPIDSGWGYIVFAGTIVRSKSDREWWPIGGYASLMPAEVPEWLSEEVPSSFLAGMVGVAPAKLVGMDLKSWTPAADAFSGIVRGVPGAASVEAAMAVLEMELPFIDGMAAMDFESLIMDHSEELEDFQQAFRDLARGYSESLEEAKAGAERFRDAARELRRSARHEQFRTMIARCRGSLTSFPFAMGILAGAGAVYAKDPFAGAAALGAAGKALKDLWEQAKEHARETTRNPLRFLFRMGAERGKFRVKKRRGRLGVVRQSPEAEIPPHHWLCPPSSAGLRFAVAEDD